MPYQSNKNVLVSYREEPAFGILPDPTGGSVMRVNSGALNLTKEPIRSAENRRDGQVTRGRHGSHNSSGSYVGEYSLGSYDALIEAAWRGTFSAPLTVTAATAGLTSVTTTAHTIIASAGSWITAGLRVGDVIRATSLATVANNDRNLRIVGLTALTITVAELLTVDAVADTAFSITRSKNLLMGTTPRSFLVEEHEYDIAGSGLFSGNRLGNFQLQMQANGMVLLTFGMVGRTMVVEDVDAPFLTDPVATTSLPMTAVEAVIRLGDEDVLELTSLDLSFNLTAAGVPVVGSNLTPEVFTNSAVPEGSISALKKDYARVKNFLNEDQLSLHLLMADKTGTLPGFGSIFIGNLTLSGATNSEIGADGGRSQTLPLMIGKDERGGAYAESTFVYQTSVA